MAGQFIFGENKVQEAIAKFSELKQRYSDIELHLIGSLQSNKVVEAIQHFDVIHTVDREKIAKAISTEIIKQGKKPKLLVQVNIGEEPQKSGVIPNQIDEFLNYCKNDLNLQVNGLMCIPPAEQESRLYFALLNKIAKRNNLEQLSMGMSNDWQNALAFEASYIRVGTAIFGQRNLN